VLLEGLLLLLLPRVLVLGLAVLPEGCCIAGYSNSSNSCMFAAADAM
jgi:hypothetical protein